jgi:hypothetical protein
MMGASSLFPPAPLAPEGVAHRTHAIIYIIPISIFILSTSKDRFQRFSQLSPADCFGRHETNAWAFL